MPTEVSSTCNAWAYVFPSSSLPSFTHLQLCLCSPSQNILACGSPRSLNLSLSHAVSRLRDSMALKPFRTKTMRLCSLRPKGEGWYCLLRRCAKLTAHGWQPTCGQDLIGALRHYASKEHAAFIRTQASSEAPATWAVWDPATTTYAVVAHLLRPTQI